MEVNNQGSPKDKCMGGIKKKKKKLSWSDSKDVAANNCFREFRMDGPS